MASKCSDKGLEGFISFNDPVSPGRLEEVARKELGETEELKAECLEKLKTLIKKNGVTCIMRDDFLLRFLRYRKFDIQRCFEAVQKYARMRVSIHERFMKLSPEVIKKCLDLNMFGFLPYRDHEERAIYFHILENWNSSIFSAEEYVMCFVLIHSYIIEKQETQVIGYVMLAYDSCGPMSIITSLFRYFHFMVNFSFGCQPARYPSIHFVTESYLLKIILRIVDPFLPKKIKDRILFHGTTGKEVSEYISLSILPNEFGGTLGPLNNDHIAEEVISFLQKMKDEQKYFIHKD